MEIREATSEDFESIRAVASASLHESYREIFDSSTIDTAVEEWYSDEVLSEQIEDEEAVLLVAETDGVAGFSQSETVGDTTIEGRILWLHIHPDERGNGYASRLFTETRAALVDRGAHRVTGRVLEGNRLGNKFYEAHGFENAGDREVEVAGESFVENVFVEAVDEEGDEWESVDEIEVEDGTVFINYAEVHRGSDGPFYEAYRDQARERRYGLFCGVCDSTDVAMSTMEEAVCNECGNRRKATRWDASYL